MRTATNVSGGKPVTSGVHDHALKWRAVPGEDDNYVYAIALL